MPEQPLITYEEMLKRRETETRLNAGNQLDVDADEATRVLRLRGLTGLPHAAIANNLDYIEKQTELGTFDPKKYRDTNPKWAEFAANNPYDLAVLKDDEPALTRVEYVLDAMFNWSSVRMASKQSFAQREIGFIGDRQRFGGGEQEGDAERLKELNKFVVPHDFDTSGLKSLVVALTKQSANMLGAYESGLEKAAVVAPVYAAGGALYGAAGGTAIIPGGGTAVGALGVGAFAYGVGFTTGMVTGLYDYGSKQEGGHAYLEYKSMGFSHEDAAWAASIVGPINGAAEAIGGNIIFSKLPGVRSMTGKIGDEVVKQLMGRRTFRAVAKKAVQDWGVANAGEVSTEVVQEATTMTLGEILKAQHDRDDMLTREQWISRIADIATETLKATVLITSIGPGQRLFTDGRRANNAKQVGQAFEALGEASKDSKLRENLPGKYREFVDKVTEDGPVKNILIDLERFVTYFQGQGKDPDEVASELGIKNLDAARELGHPLEIPVGEYAEKIAPTEHHGGLMPDIRIKDGDMTLRQAEEFDKIKPQLEKEINELASPTDDATSVENQRAVQEVAAQLVEGGTNAVEAQRQAQVMVGFANLDQKMGFAPGTLIKRMFAGVRKDLPEGVQGEDFDIYIDPLLNKLRAEEFPSQYEMHGESLLEMLKKRGGLSDEGGELAARDWNDLIEKGGDSLDGAAEIAHEAGFIADRDPELLMEAIAAERDGTPVYGFDSPGDPLMRQLGERLEELASFIQAEGIDLATLSNVEVRELLEAGDTFEQFDFDALRERMESQDMAQMMGGMPHIFDEQDFGDLTFTDRVRVQGLDETVLITESAQERFDLAIKRRNGLRRLLECVSG